MKSEQEEMDGRIERVGINTPKALELANAFGV
jgi:hypothetical protein